MVGILHRDEIAKLPQCGYRIGGVKCSNQIDRSNQFKYTAVQEERGPRKATSSTCKIPAMARSSSESTMTPNPGVATNRVGGNTD